MNSPKGKLDSEAANHCAMKSQCPIPCEWGSRRGITVQYSTELFDGAPLTQNSKPPHRIPGS